MSDISNESTLQTISVKKIFFDKEPLDESRKKLVRELQNRGISADYDRLILNQKTLEIFNKNSNKIIKTPINDPNKKIPCYDLNLDNFLSSLDNYQQSLLKPIEPEPLKAEWKIFEPSDKEDPADLETSAYQINDEKSFIAVGGSIRGKYHAHNALHREDSFNFHVSDRWSVIAVADGAGSCRLSRVGSKLAVNNAILFLEEKLLEHNLSESEGINQPLNDELLPLREFLVECIIDCRTKLETEATQRGIDVKELSTTLLVTILRRWKDKVLIAGIQVGDGTIVILSNNFVTTISEGDSGEFAGETTFITSKSIDSRLRHKVQFTLKQDFQAIALMTDGVADDFFPTDPVMIKLFESVLPLFTENPDELKTALLNWMKYERPGSFDDRTLVILKNKLHNNG
jgi:serine/threonine protein phosphatase PrpC